MTYTSFILYSFIMTITPGPTNIVILSTVHHFGIKKAMEYTYGATVAFALLLFISASLNSMFISVIPNILIYMKIIGSLYMLFLAYQIYSTDSTKPPVSRTGTFYSGLFMQFLNPKVVLFTMTVIPSFILPYYVTSKEIILNVLLITLIGFVAFLSWVLFGKMFRKLLLKYSKFVNILLSLFLVYAAIMIWL
ncbi:LysE family translocator [Cytobacillus purgationiresistens]|uniref:Threonine/homoserine/homoserine lactone efflux protein n=1 Tax=Cytobacillus purgationiresistens TaxID=863449 RepID=A0ABU0ALE7_9BACI|nr:LysE family transporter [Cytobacillus purgationiresistens]MDQ0271714.1 threonine/homoserine/homoserine lactone efflux protein [Cytobacillus purgationiresistens]